MIGAVDIGGTKIAAGAVDEAGHVFAMRSHPTGTHLGPEYGLRQVVDMLHEIEADTGAKLGGVGVGITGRVYPRGGMLGKNDFLLGWEGIDLSEQLSRAVNLPITVENDANATALGEWAWGAGQGSHLFAMVTAGTGIGVGLVFDGQIYRGVNGAHPEIGHHVIDPSGPLCYCGRKGCWESLASASAMEKWAQANHPQNIPRTAKQLCERSAQGDPYAQAAVERTVWYFALGIANLVSMIAPERIALGGGLMQSHPLFMPAIQEMVATSCNLVPCHDIEIVPANLGALGGLVGAAWVWYSQHGIST